MKKIVAVLSFIISVSSFAQVSVKTSNTNTYNKWTFGGNVGVGFGNNSSFNLQASPRVGYRLAENLEAGVVGSISWQTSDYYRSTMIGVGPFMNYYFGRSFYLGANFQEYFIDYKDKYYGYKSSTEESALYLGGGYMQRLGGNSYMQIGVMYNVLWKENASAFSSGFVPSVGFVVGL